MSKYEQAAKFMRATLRSIQPECRAKYVCGYVAEVLQKDDRPQIKLSKISAAIEALERIGKE